MERRSKGGRERNIKGSQKNSKSLQTNNSVSSSSCDEDFKAQGRTISESSITNYSSSFSLFFSTFETLILDFQAPNMGSQVSWLLGEILHSMFKLS